VINRLSLVETKKEAKRGIKNQRRLFLIISYKKKFEIVFQNFQNIFESLLKIFQNPEFSNDQKRLHLGIKRKTNSKTSG
jgi:hypothetical protein